MLQRSDEMDFEADKLCRICLKVSDARMEPIFNYEIEDVPVINVVRKVCYSVHIFKHDGYPEK